MADYSPDEKLIKRPPDDSPLTKEQEEEWIKCAIDKYYFFEKYVKIQTDQGKKPFIARSYQKRMLDAAEENRFVVCLVGRQAGKCCLGDTKMLVKVEVDGIMYEEFLTMEQVHDLSKSKTPEDARIFLQSIKT